MELLGHSFIKYKYYNEYYQCNGCGIICFLQDDIFLISSLSPVLSEKINRVLKQTCNEIIIQQIIE